MAHGIRLILLGLVIPALCGCRNLPIQRLLETSAEITPVEAISQAPLTKTPSVTPFHSPSPSATPTAIALPVINRTLAPGQFEVVCDPLTFVCYIPDATDAPLRGTPTLSPDMFHGSYDYKVKYQSQVGLTYFGRETNSGCTAAAVSMMLSFWHDYNSAYPMLGAQTLLDMNAAQGAFNPADGLATLDTEDELVYLGYYLGYKRNSIKEELLAALERYGPLQVLTKTNWVPTGRNHAAVLVKYDEKEDKVTLNDPWSGSPITLDYNAFDGIWGLNYAPDDTTQPLRRTFFFIAPMKELRPGQDLFIPRWKKPEK